MLDLCSKIEQEIQDNYEQTSQRRSQLNQKYAARKELFKLFRAHFFCDLYIVGSSVSGLSRTTSDSDMCLVLADMPNEQFDVNEATAMLETVSKIIMKTKNYTEITIIKARVPLLKFREMSSGVQVDLNIGNAVGIRNTHLVKSYCDADVRVAPLVLAVKRWATSNAINNAHHKTISSYSYTLMVIHYLQYGINGHPVLPCLQKSYPELFHEASDIKRLQLNEPGPEFCSENKSSVGELFVGFIRYFAREFRYYEDVISVRTGNLISKQVARMYRCAKNSPHDWPFLGIEEPYERTNTARSVHDAMIFSRILDVFKDADRRLSQGQTFVCLLNLHGPQQRTSPTVGR